MNIILRELKMRWKVLLIWLLGIGLLVYFGMIKFEGFADAGMGMLTDFIDSFPRIILSLFGMAGVNILELPGYFTVIGYMVMFCGAIYATGLGTGIVTDEIVDKNADFLYTKPRKRSFVLSMKLLTAVGLLMLFTAVFLLTGKIAVLAVEPDANIDRIILQYAAVIFLVNLVFLGLASFLSAALRKPEQAKKASLRTLLLLFGAGIAYDMVEAASWIRYLTPFRWFEAPSLLAKGLEPLYLLITGGVIAALLIATYVSFQRKDIL